MKIKKLDSLVPGDCLKRLKDNQVQELEVIFHENNGNYYKFYGYSVHQKVMKKMFETDISGNFIIYEKE